MTVPPDVDVDRWRVPPRSRPRLHAIPTDGTAGAPGDKRTTKADLPHRRVELGELHRRLREEGRRSVLVVLHDLGGRREHRTVERVLSECAEGDLRVASLTCPREATHDFLWEVHAHAPATGRMTVMDGAHHHHHLLMAGLDPGATGDDRRTCYDHVRAFERLLVDAGTSVVKLHLHRGPDTYPGRVRSQLDDRRRAAAEAMAATSMTDAPWFVVPSDRRWYREWVVSRILAAALQDLHRPPATEDSREATHRASPATGPDVSSEVARRASPGTG